MSVSVGVGGTTVGGVLVGASADPTVVALPFTGAPHVLLLLVMGLIMVTAGILTLGLERRHARVVPAAPARVSPPPPST